MANRSGLITVLIKNNVFQNLGKVKKRVKPIPPSPVIRHEIDTQVHLME